MHKLKPLTLVMIRDHFREFETVFWTILFPTLILILFVGVFGQMFSEEGVDPSLSYGVYYEETTHGMTDGSSGDFSQRSGTPESSPSPSPSWRKRRTEETSFETGTLMPSWSSPRDSVS